MPVRLDQTAWTNELELADLRRWTEVDGLTKERAAIALNEKYHKGKPVRTAASVSMMRTRRKWYVAKIPTAHKEVGPRKEQEVEREEGPDGIVLKSRGSRIKTVAELLKHANVTGEVTKQTVKTWDTTLVENGESKTVQNFAIHVEVKPNQTSTAEAVQAIIDGAFAKRTLLPKTKTPKLATKRQELLQGIVIADPHISKLSWGVGTGGPDYDTNIAIKTLREGFTALLNAGIDRRVGRRGIWLLGDYLHHDGQGATTKGTILDYDSRLPKMLRSGTELLFDLIAASADDCPTDVVLVPGNHDKSLTTAVQLILEAEFRRDKRVSINTQPRTTKYVQHGKVLIGLDHGNLGKKRLAEVMPAMCATEWGQTIYREIHTGHLHSKAAIETHGGITIRTHAAICAADQYHVDEKFNTSPRMMEAFTYHSGGALAGSDAWSPDLHAAPTRGTR